MSAPESKLNHLVISAIGSDKPGIVNELAKTCSALSCNIIDSRMTVLGGEFAIIMLVSGAWDSMAKLENNIQQVAKKLDLTTIVKRTTQRSLNATVTYSVSVVALDNPGIVHELAQYFSSQKINIEDLQTGTYCAPHTGTQMFNLNMLINIPVQTHIPTLREEFMDFCDDLNLDAIIEPYRSA